MNRRVLVFLAAVLFSLTVIAQQTATANVPRLLRFGGTIKFADGTPRTGVVGVMFSLYAEQQGGVALWTELQNVQLDANGQYSVLLGSQHAEGVPAELFTANEARWLGIQVEAEAEQPRILLVSVPYALKAADAETLGGRPLSAFVMAEPSAAGTATGTSTTTPSATVASANITPYSVNTGTSGGTQNMIAKWIDASTLGDSTIFENANGYVGMGTTAPGGKLDVRLTTPTALSTINSAMTLTNSSPITSDIITALTLAVTDMSTATNLSKQTMRMAYIRDAAATGGVSAYDTIFTATPIINANAPYTLIGLNLEGPSVATGKTLSTFYGALIGAGGGGGTVTNRYALVTAAGAGNVGINTTSPVAPLNLVADNPGGSDRANQMVLQGSSNPNLRLNVGIHTEASPAYAELGLVEEGVAWRNLVLGKNGGAVGIGTANPTSPLTVAGTIQSTSGGFKFPDASVQTAAGVTGVNASSGITGSIGSGLLTLTADTTYLQRRVSGTCATGTTMASVAADGSVTCITVSGGGSLTPPVVLTANIPGGGTTVTNLATFYAANTAVGISNPDPNTNFPPAGLIGHASNTSATGFTIGVIGRTDGPIGAGVVAMATGAGTVNDRATGLTAFATSTTGRTKAIEGEVYSASGTALSLSAPPGATLMDVSTSTGPNTGTGVFHLDGSNASFTVPSFSINGPSAPTNVSISGNLNVNGTLTKSSGTFKIDHPLDPANKYLYHSFVESPDMMNVYNGVVVLDARGQAWIQLPDYFEALNQDFRYQLTSIGRFMPVYIAREISGNRFRIAGGKPHGKVSWQVTGIRHDAYADAHRIQVEVEKPGAERGTYLHPELFGQKGVTVGTVDVAPKSVAPSPVGENK